MSKRAKERASEYANSPRPEKTSYEEYLAGYEQAEKDLALTWEDVKRVVEIADMLCPYAPKDIAEFQAEFQTEDAYYREVLKQYNNGKVLPRLK